MLKTVSSAIAATVIATSASYAGVSATSPRPHARVAHRVLANGRCDGISYGTGARSCGTLTGGPAGGNSSRN